MRFFLLTLSLCFTLLAGVVEQSEIVGDSKSTEVTFIKLRDVPQESANISVVIDRAVKTLASKENVNDIESALKVYSTTIDTLLDDARTDYLEYVSIRDLTKYQDELHINLTQLESWKTILEERITVFDEYKKELGKYGEIWNKTYKNAQVQKAPVAILKQIKTVRIELEELSVKGKNRYDTLLTDSSTIHTKIIEMQEMQKKVLEAINIVSSKVFYQNNLSLIDLLKENGFNPEIFFISAINSLIEKAQETRSFYSTESEKLFIFGLISLGIFALVFIFFYLYKSRKLFVYANSYRKKEFIYIRYPFSTLVILLLFANTLFFDLSQSVKEIQLLILLIPVFRILQVQFPKKIIRHVYIYFLLYTLSIILNNAVDTPLDSRFFGILLEMLLFILLYKLIKDKVFSFLKKDSIKNAIYKLLGVCAALVLIAIGADVYGATLLASNISNGIFTLLYASMIFYLLSTILTGYIVILLRRRIASASFPILKKFTLNIEKMTIMFVKIFMFAWWFIIVSKTIGVYEHIVEVKNSLMSLAWKFGETTISVSSIFDFFLIIFSTWFLLKLINIILQVEIFSRFKFPRGFPTAITTVLNYTIVISGGMIALMSLGVTTEQFTLVFGALGVGIGFGLRNIIANFISGIIMVFERPIQIGDTIEINKILGKVQAIGTRSSTIKTFDGSEVIIPNADFIAKDITNWTLSDEHRRKILSFKVDLESDIEEVLTIMKSVAVSHKDVLKNPEPLATFVGFGEYYLEFKLYFWLDENLIIAPSDIAIGVYTRLKEHNIKMPIQKQHFIDKEEK